MIIAMWSGPRNLSTAMMRSFGSRTDTAVWDEPFFAPYLKATGKAHPGRSETLAAHETDAETIAEQCAAPPPHGATYYFQKHMPHHMLDGFPMDWAKRAKHFFLIRHPARVIASYAKGREAFEVDDLGFAPQRKLWEALGRPPVIESEAILRAPEAALSALCAAIDIPFDPAMLSWAAGPRETDGAWAPYWYKSVEASTGFTAPPANLPEVPDQYRDMLSACMTDYSELKAAAIRI